MLKDTKDMWRDRIAMSCEGCKKESRPITNFVAQICSVNSPETLQFYGAVNM
ncbi:hypothetical protein F9C07_12442 [Aspergillus flavus]|uniref:Uncharacterized protein n=1 Tax=Aspergillus flavus (strain ATCC 200026 / FGSC A1120 / IAM 13836 / NRRL 3357 / JCM 12722 / SRRC 167) TaxID=332952 RepID=A0A7U2MYZ3_ASPFN|nr:hypothetical protein F9C07_12442 [Aspergillus flavus]